MARQTRKSRISPPRRLSSNMEDYLEAIYQLSDKNGVSKVSTIAQAVGVKKPSVSKALKRLHREGLVTHTPYGGASLTSRGKEVAQAQVRSHRALTRFLQQVLALDPALAEHDACLMEHAISHETVERLVSFIDYLERHGVEAVNAFRQSLNRKDPEMDSQAINKKVKTKSAISLSSASRTWTSRV